MIAKYELLSYVSIAAVTIYSFGGLFFFSSGLFMAKRYFYEQNKVRV